MKSVGLMVLTVMLLLASCRNPLQELLQSSPASDTGTITVSLSARNGARTVVPNYVSQVDAIEVNLVSNDGYPSLSSSVTAAPWRVTFNDVRAGSWNIKVAAVKGGVQVGSGEAAGQTLNQGASLSVPVTVAFSPTGTSGDVSFTVSFPASTNIDHVVGIGPTGASSEPPIVDVGSMKSATLSFSSLAPGTYQVPIIFHRGGSAGVLAGYFLEQVVVVAGFTSGSWVAADGSLATERVFTATDFFDNNSSLANLALNGVAWRGFSSDITDYTLDPTEASTVTFQASTSVPGQYLQYRWNGSTLAEIVPDTESSTLVLIDDPAVFLTDNTLEIVVTAPDRKTITTYAVRLSKGYTVGYSTTGTTGGVPPVDPGVYEAGQTVTVLGNPGNLTYLPSYALSGWMAAGDPTFYAVGSSYTIPAGQTVFDSQWDRWTRLFGASGVSITDNGIAVDSSGSSFVVGTTSVSLDGQTLNGLQDAFITKYDTAGTKQWTRLVGATGETTYGNAVSVGTDGSCYITGAVTGYGSRLLDGVPVTGNTDVFVVKYDMDGVKQWTQLSGVVGHSTCGNGISASPTGGCAVTGYTDGDLDGEVLTGTRDTFVMKYDTGGGKMWTQLYGAVGSSIVGKAISVDAADSCYVTGSAIGGLVDRPPIGLRDAFVVKYDLSGTEQWNALSGVAGVYTDGSGIAVDPAGDCYVTGSTSGMLDGEIRTGDYDAFVMRYDAMSGVKLWTRLCGGTSGSLTGGTGICVDPGGICYVAGHTTGGFDGWPPIGQEDTFVISYDLAGTKLWSKLAGVAGAVTEGTGMSVDPSMNTYVTGTTSGPLDGQPLTGTLDVFVTTRLNP